MRELLAGLGAFGTEELRRRPRKGATPTAGGDTPSILSKIFT